jgi:hypothetical protein
MPNFKKSKGYKMKGFSGFGNSPAKVSLSEVREAAAGVNKAELGYRPKGWAVGAKAAQETIKKNAMDIAGAMDIEKGDEEKEDE